MTKIFGYCPDCAASHRTLGRGLLARHGFSARFPHGLHNGGFHSGSCSGSGNLPIGTAQGDRRAVDNATRLRTAAEQIETAPHATLAEALSVYLGARKARASISTFAARRERDLAEYTELSTVLTARLEAGDLSARMPARSGHYVSIGEFLTQQATRLQADRLARAAGLRAVAAELERLVEEVRRDNGLAHPPC